MEFKRINKDTVTCIITEDDMFEQGIKLEDLFEKKKEAMDFLHEVMKKAEEEVDYKPTGAFMPMQITVLPDHSISLTLSENASASFSEILKNLTEKAGIQIPKNVLEDIGDSASEERINRLNEYLKSLKQLTNSVKDIVGETSDKISVNSNATAQSNKSKADKISTGAGRKKELTEEQKNEKKLKFHEYVFEFNDLNTVIRFCKKAPKGLKISSSLYKNAVNGRYYLDLLRQSEEPKVFASLFTMAYEFGHFQASNLHVIAHIKENYDCIIKCNAINELSSLDM
jgi:adapter protein MecA 1/2